MKDYKHMSYEDIDKTLEKEELHPSFFKCQVETAGFIPLEVRLKQLEQQGYVAKFTKDDFTSDDMRLIWLDPENEILPGDDIEDIQRKQLARKSIMADIMSKKVDSEEIEPTGKVPVEKVAKATEKEE